MNSGRHQRVKLYEIYTGRLPGVKNGTMIWLGLTIRVKMSQLAEFQLRWHDTLRSHMLQYGRM